MRGDAYRTDAQGRRAPLPPARAGAAAAGPSQPPVTAGCAIAVRALRRLAHRLVTPKMQRTGRSACRKPRDFVTFCVASSGLLKRYNKWVSNQARRAGFAHCSGMRAVGASRPPAGTSASAGRRSTGGNGGTTRCIRRRRCAAGAGRRGHHRAASSFPMFWRSPCQGPDGGAPGSAPHYSPTSPRTTSAIVRTRRRSGRSGAGSRRSAPAARSATDAAACMGRGCTRCGGTFCNWEW